MYDGKKVNGRERMVVLVQFSDESGNKVEKFIAIKTFDKEDAITGQQLFSTMTEELFTDSLLDKVQSVLSDTTAVNTGSKKGINTRLREFFKNKMGRDIHPFECLFHVLELNLNHFIKSQQGDRKSANKMQAGSVYDLIESIEISKLTKDNLKNNNFLIRINH